MCQASSRTGFQSDVHHHRSFGPHGAGTRQQNITADLASAQGEPRRRVESKGNVLLYPFSLKNSNLTVKWVSKTLTCCFQKEINIQHLAAAPLFLVCTHPTNNRSQLQLCDLMSSSKCQTNVLFSYIIYSIPVHIRWKFISEKRISQVMTSLIDKCKHTRHTEL